MAETSQITFKGFDKLDLGTFCQRLERFLTIEHDFVDGSLVVSLNAPFGAGKTTFLSMWKSDLDEHRKNDPNVPEALIINAWESDYCGDPLLSLINGLIKATEQQKPAHRPEAVAKLREAAKDVSWFVTGLANNLASHWTGFDPISAAQLAEEKKANRKAQIPDFVSLYDERTRALRQLKESLISVFGGELPKAFVFIDELDRCRPDYAISYLETVKHVFDIHGLVFVLAVDCQQLECSAKALFGQGLNFSDYLRKFVQRTISLPEANKAAIEKLARCYVTRYFEREAKRFCLMKLDGFEIEHIVELIAHLRMPPRQIEETFRIIGHAVSGDEARRGRLLWAIGPGVMLMSALKVARPEVYHRFGRCVATHEEIGKFLVNLFGQKGAYWWFQLYLTGCGERIDKEKMDFGELYGAVGFEKADYPPKFVQHLGEFGMGWGPYSKDRWTEIYEKIESATSFGDS